MNIKEWNNMYLKTKKYGFSCMNYFGEPSFKNGVKLVWAWLRFFVADAAFNCRHQNTQDLDRIVRIVSYEVEEKAVKRYNLD